MTGGNAILQRRLGVFDATVIGLGSMIGAGVFAAFAPAARAAGSGLLAGLAAAAAVAYCNAMSSARLAALYPASGGTYVYGRERLGPFWGYLAGWSFIVGKTASCGAMALTIGAYVWPEQQRAVGVAAVVALTAVNYAGVQKAAWLTRGIVAVVLALLTAFVVAAFTGGDADAARLDIGADATVGGALQAAGLLFFAFAGYARIATLGEEVRDPARTIPRAIPLALGITLVVYAAVAVALLAVLGPQGLAGSAAPLADAAGGLAPLMRVGAAVAAVGSLLALILGVSRTTLAMARDGHLPRTLAAVHPVPGSRTTPNSPSARSSRSSPPPPTCAARSASPPSASSPTTPSPTPPPGPSAPAPGAPYPRSACSAASSWPSPCPGPPSPRARPSWPSARRCTRHAPGAPGAPDAPSPGRPGDGVLPD